MIRRVPRTAETATKPRGVPNYPPECDLLILRPRHPSYDGYRCQMDADAWSVVSNQSAAISYAANDPDWLEGAIRATGARVVIIHAMIVGPVHVRAVAGKLPDVTFVQICHDSLPAAMSTSNGTGGLHEAIKATLECDNVWLATPDERNPLRQIRDCERLAWYPNPVRIPEWRDELASPRSIPTVLLCSRPDPLKNMASQLAACALLRGQINPVVVRQGKGLATMCQALDLTPKFIPHMGQWNWLEHLATEVDLLLACSFTESFGYNAIEALVRGVPVIGSPALRFLPKEWQANPDNPAEIADKSRSVVSGQRSEVSEKAREIGVSVAEYQNTAHRDFLAKLT